MHFEHLGLGRDPFAEEPDPDIFFQDAGRIDLLRAVYADLQGRASVIKITGAEGAGKTLLCLLLTRLLPAGFQVIYLASPGGSFDELVQAVGAEFGLDGAGDVLAALIERHRQQEKKVLLLVDEAEKMFPAALERLLRTACAAEEQTLQVILAGRPSLNSHLAQLTVHCPDLAVQADHLLKPLTEAESEAYLIFRLKAAGMTAADSRAVFSGGAVHRLFERAGGNLRLLHSLAGQALLKAGQELPVLAAHVPAAATQAAKKGAPVNLGRVLKAAAATAFVLLAALLVFSQQHVRREKRAEPPVSNELPVSVPVPSVKTQEEEPPEPAAAAPEEKPAEPVELFPAAQPAPPEPAASEAGAEAEPLTAAQEPAAPPEVEPEPENTLPAAQPDATPAAAAEQGQEQEPPAGQNAPEAESLPAEPLYTPPPPAEQPQLAPPPAMPLKKIIQLVPGRRKSKPAEKRPEQLLPPAAGPSVASPPPDGERLYQELLTSGSRLKSRPHEGRYTIQLLTLSAPDAAVQLKEMIVREEYLEHKNQLQLLRKKTQPAGLLVFYGSYTSMEEAKTALDGMPLFLRKHHPYVVPVDGALEKAGE